MKTAQALRRLYGKSSHPQVGRDAARRSIQLVTLAFHFLECGPAVTSGGMFCMDPASVHRPAGNIASQSY